jgi:hypothetical protein
MQQTSEKVLALEKEIEASKDKLNTSNEDVRNSLPTFVQPHHKICSFLYLPAFLQLVSKSREMDILLHQTQELEAELTSCKKLL